MKLERKSTMRKLYFALIYLSLAHAAQAETHTYLCDEVFRTSSINSESENTQTPITTIVVEVVDGKTHCTIQEVYE